MMAVPAVQSVDAESLAQNMVGPATNQPVATTNGQSFSSWIAGEISATNRRLIQAENGVQQLALGEPSNLHEVMIRLEEARLSLQLMVQVRNRVLEAYQEVMRMQA